MTSLRDRPNAPVLVVDVQMDVVANAHRRDEVIANISTVVDKARSEQITNMYWTWQSGPGCTASVVETAADDLVGDD